MYNILKKNTYQGSIILILSICCVTLAHAQAPVMSYSTPPPVNPNNPGTITTYTSPQQTSGWTIGTQTGFGGGATQTVGTSVVTSGQAATFTGGTQTATSVAGSTCAAAGLVSLTQLVQNPSILNNLSVVQRVSVLSSMYTQMYARVQTACGGISNSQCTSIYAQLNQLSSHAASMGINLTAVSTASMVNIQQAQLTSFTSQFLATMGPLLTTVQTLEQHTFTQVYTQITTSLDQLSYIQWSVPSQALFVNSLQSFSSRLSSILTSVGGTNFSASSSSVSLQSAIQSIIELRTEVNSLLACASNYNAYVPYTTNPPQWGTTTPTNNRDEFNAKEFQTACRVCYPNSPQTDNQQVPNHNYLDVNGNMTVVTNKVCGMCPPEYKLGQR